MNDRRAGERIRCWRVSVEGLGAAAVMGVWMTWVSGCGAAADRPPSVPEGSGEVEVDLATLAADTSAMDQRPAVARAAALPMRPEAWPRRLNGDPDAIAAPASTTLAFESSAEARFPWVFVVHLPGGPWRVAAVAMHGVDDARLVRDFSILTFAGELVLDRSVYSQFLQLSDRAGAATLQRAEGWQLFVFPQPLDASFVTLRALSNHGADTTGLGAVRLLDPDMLHAFRASYPEIQPVVLRVEERTGLLDGLILPTRGDEGSGAPGFEFPETGIDVFHGETD